MLNADDRLGTISTHVHPYKTHRKRPGVAPEPGTVDGSEVSQTVAVQLISQTEVS